MKVQLRSTLRNLVRFEAMKSERRQRTVIINGKRRPLFLKRCDCAVDKHERVLFHPTDDECYDQCYNLDCTLAAFLLPRLVWFRKHRTGTPCGTSRKKYDEVLDAIIEGLWVRVNEPSYLTRDPRVEKAVRLLWRYWESLWL